MLSKLPIFGANGHLRLLTWPSAGRFQVILSTTKLEARLMAENYNALIEFLFS